MAATHTHDEQERIALGVHPDSLSAHLREAHGLPADDGRVSAPDLRSDHEEAHGTGTGWHDGPAAEPARLPPPDTADGLEVQARRLVHDAYSVPLVRDMRKDMDAAGQLIRRAFLAGQKDIQARALAGTAAAQVVREALAALDEALPVPDRATPDSALREHVMTMRERAFSTALAMAAGQEAGND
jgi:hypothetical protein